MRKLRFNIASLLTIILILGIGFAALRESSVLSESGIFTVTLGILLISILLAVHRSESKRAFWLGFALFGWAMGLTLVPSIESRLITTKALAFLDSKVPRSISAQLAYFDYGVGSPDLVFVNDSQPNALYLNKGNGTFEDVTAVAGSNPARKQAWFSNILVGSSRNGSLGTTGHFVKIGHSLLAVVAALLGGQLSRYLHTKNRLGTSGPVPAPLPTSNDSGV